MMTEKKAKTILYAYTGLIAILWCWVGYVWGRVDALSGIKNWFENKMNELKQKKVKGT